MADAEGVSEFDGLLCSSGGAGWGVENVTVLGGPVVEASNKLIGTPPQAFPTDARNTGVKTARDSFMNPSEGDARIGLIAE